MVKFVILSPHFEGFFDKNDNGRALIPIHPNS